MRSELRRSERNRLQHTGVGLIIESLEDFPNPIFELRIEWTRLPALRHRWWSDLSTTHDILGRLAVHIPIVFFTYLHVAKQLKNIL